MEIISKYIAFDGTEFDNEEECFEFETSLLWQEANRSVTFLDKAGNPIEVKTSGDYEDKVEFIIIPNYGAYRDLERVLDEIGYYCPKVTMDTPMPTVFAYPGDNWTNITEFLPTFGKLANAIIKEV